MRVVDEIPHPVYKITVFKSGMRHLLKVETSDFEQTIKFKDGEANSVAEIRSMVDGGFLQSVKPVFGLMAKQKRSMLAKKKANDAEDWEEII